MNTATVSRPTTTKFVDNTTTNPIDRTRVYGFAPGLKYMPVRGLVAGRSHIGQGQLVAFLPRVEGFLDAMYRPQTQEFSARAQARQVQAKYTGGAAGDTGFRILDMLTDLPYDKHTGEDEAELYFSVVHPNRIGRCEMGLETNVGGDWELSGGPNSTAVPTPLSRDNPNHPSDPCATCRLQWLKSNELTAQIEASGLDIGVLNDLRKKLTDSYSAFIAFARKKVDESKGEIASSAAGNVGKKAYDETDYYYMSVLHEKAPHVQQAELVNEQAKAQGAEMAKVLAEAIRGNAVNASPAVTVSGNTNEVAELKKQLAEMQNMIASLAAQGIAPDVTVAESVPATEEVSASNDADELLAMVTEDKPKRRR